MAGAVLPREGLTGIGFGHRKSWVGIVIHSMAVILSVQCMGEGASSLRLVPFPKEVQILDGVFEFRDPLVLEAFRKVPRHEFLPEALRDTAYGDYPLPIGNSQTISQPYIAALMTEQLGLKGGERILEIGTGSGYQAAILAEIAGQVY